MGEQRRILVVGSNSFAAGDFIDLLLDDPANLVTGVSRSAQKSSLYLPYRERQSPNFIFHQWDINRDMEALLEFCDQWRPGYLVNFSAQGEVGPSWDHPEQWFTTNVAALARLANFLRGKDYLVRFVQISSPEVYGSCDRPLTEYAPFNPSTPYAVSKAAADMFLTTLVRHHGFPLVTIRSTNYYGARQQLWKIIPRALIYLKLGRVIELHGGGMAVKSFLHVRDVSRGEVAAMLHGTQGGIYHLSPERGWSVREIVKRLCALAGADFTQAARDVGERLGQDAAYLVESAKSRAELGWTPRVELDQGLAQVAAWVDDNWEAIKAEPLNYRHRA